MSIHLMNFKTCSVVLGKGLLKSNLIAESCQTQSVAILCDENVKVLYGEALKGSLQNEGLEVYLFSFPSGETSKNRLTKACIEDQMQACMLGRDTTLIGIGGGVTTDLAGFIASTYCRGVPLILIPTSLLAMVDASLGGKTGVNTAYGKNLIGTFYIPEFILIDTNCLNSLPPKEVLEGLIEIIKVAAVYDAALFEKIEISYSSLADHPKDYIELIKAACEIKIAVVEQDFEEKEGVRRILNFGHTVGHALEHYFEYQVGHGTAVALGMIAESFMACEMGLLSLVDFHRMVNLLKGFISMKPFEIQEVIDCMALDKKTHDKTPRFVLLNQIGSVCECSGNYCAPVENELIVSALQFIKELVM